MQTFRGRDTKCLMFRFVEVFAELHQLGAEGGDGGILVERIILRHVNGCWKAGAGGRKSDGLAMIAARRGNHARDIGIFFAKSIQVHQSATDFEGAGRRVIFMLDPYGTTGTSLELRPGVLRRGWDYTMHQLRRMLQIGHVEYTGHVHRGTGELAFDH